MQLSTLILWVSQSAFRTRTTLAAAVLTLVATIGLCFLSYAEHSRSVRPSSLLNTFLLATLVFDAAHARTLWLGATATFGHAIALEAIVALSIKAVVLLLEATEKRVLLKTPYRSYPREAVGGILNRSFFWWLNPLFFLGYRQVLEIDDLYALDKHLEAARLQRSLQSAWTRGETKNPMLRGAGSIGRLTRRSLVTSSWQDTQFCVAPPHVLSRSALARDLDSATPRRPHRPQLLPAVPGPSDHHAVAASHRP